MTFYRQIDAACVEAACAALNIDISQHDLDAMRRIVHSCQTSDDPDISGLRTPIDVARFHLISCIHLVYIRYEIGVGARVFDDLVSDLAADVVGLVIQDEYIQNNYLYYFRTACGTYTDDDVFTSAVFNDMPDLLGYDYHQLIDYVNDTACVDDIPDDDIPDYDYPEDFIPKVIGNQFGLWSDYTVYVKNTKVGQDYVIYTTKKSHLIRIKNHKITCRTNIKRNEPLRLVSHCGYDLWLVR